MTETEGYPSGFVGASALELAKLIRDGEASSLEVVDAHINRVEQVEPAINAVAADMFEQARAQARAADRCRADGSAPGALQGVPISIKGQFMVQGTETTLGLPGQRGGLDEREGPLVSNLRRAGAIFLAKTNMMQLLMGYETDNPLYGRSNNPWDLSRTPGGSSGGEAALIAAHGTPLGLGGDLAGSIRIPAHFCGIHGFTPTPRRLPLDDTPAHFFPRGQESIIPQPGPLARTMADIILAMDVLTAPYDRTLADKVPPVPWRSPKDIRVENLKIGMFEDNGLFSPAPAIRRAVGQAAGYLQDAGAIVEPFEAPDPWPAIGLFLDIVTADGWSTVSGVLGHDKPNPMLKQVQQLATLPRALRPVISRILGLTGQEFPARLIRHGGARPVREYWQRAAARIDFANGLIDGMAKSGVDVLLSPPFALPAPLHGATTDLLPAVSYALMPSVAGMCSGVVAATRVRQGENDAGRPLSSQEAKTAARSELDCVGLPVGVQVIGPPWQDAKVLAVMAALETGFQSSDPDWPLTGPAPPAIPSAR